MEKRKRLSAWYSNEKMILSDFSFVLAQHEVVGLIGLNGAGMFLTGIERNVIVFM